MTEHPYVVYTKIAEQWTQCRTKHGRRSDPFTAAEVVELMMILALAESRANAYEKLTLDLAAIRDHLAKAANA